ncbi:hypothetical protein TSC_c00710 [Thermus scotoductus SA-01]|uniref:Uncharacterized protein n=1 Tax=Thermus scotoductus (strain ATCC 700910 / SA-01) TaxID=743525 RepID=E8PR63_THESS|nr:hypothetical protein TSC_c00710 [Thermus scotoductus SA-01]
MGRLGQRGPPPLAKEPLRKVAFRLARARNPTAPPPLQENP